MQNVIKPKRLEDQLHNQCVRWFYLQHGNSLAILHHSPNENPKGNRVQMIRYNGKMKQQGRLAGFPDIIIFHKEKVLLIELKSQIGRLGDVQKELFPKLKDAGFEVKVIRDFESFCSVVNGFLV